MSDKLNQISRLVKSLTLQDVVSEHHRLDNTFLVLIEDLQQLRGKYSSSGYAAMAARADRERYTAAMNTRRENERRRGEWCKKQLKVGDWVKVSGSGVKKPYRKVLELNETVFQNRPGDPLMESMTGHRTETGYQFVTHIMDPATKTLVKLDVKLIDSINKE